jgi:hypothetical protein
VTSNGSDHWVIEVDGLDAGYNGNPVVREVPVRPWRQSVAVTRAADPAPVHPTEAGRS